MYFGIIMILVSSIQYIYILINYNLQNKLIINTNSFDFIPLLFIILSLGTLYLQMKNNNIINKN